MQIRLAAKSTDEYIQMKNIEINADDRMKELAAENKLLQTQMEEFNKERFIE